MRGQASAARGAVQLTFGLRVLNGKVADGGRVDSQIASLGACECVSRIDIKAWLGMGCWSHAFKDG